ncbi:MAG: YceI family protein [Gammaproteobacteria bacterium]|nr:YceI family protein [Gammaproteobacteria bacterium]
MKAMIKKAIFVASALTMAISTSVFAAETYLIDPHHTAVTWHINHFGFSNPSGKWYADGTIMLDEAKPQDSVVDVTIHTANVITGIPELDEHLRSKAFFETDKFPLATFKSDKVTLTGKDTAKVKGILTMHGVSKSVTLNVKLNKIGMNPIINKKTVGFTATTELKRSDFNMNTLVPNLGDEVKIDIEAEANLASDAGTPAAAPAAAPSAS